MRRLRELLLWAGAALGLLAVAAGLAVAFGGFSFLIFRSGSMSPEIPTGGIALARTVPAADLASGDVVSVTAANGDRITHRIVSSTLRGDQATLVLKGDANATEDSELYVVTSAERVVASLPYGGYVLVHALTPPGLLAMACLSLMLIVISGGERQGDTASGETRYRTRRLAQHRGRVPVRSRLLTIGTLGVLVVSGGVAVAHTAGTWATFTDRPTANLASNAYTSASVAPTLPTVTQTVGSGDGAISWAASSVGATTARTYDVLRYTANTGGTGTVVCADITTTSCTEAKPATASSNTTYYYSVRSEYPALWSTESARRAYTADAIAPTATITTPVLTACATTVAACGTAADTGGGTVASVDFTLRRARTPFLSATTYQCWTGSAYVAATGTTCPTYYDATGTTSWTVPGAKATVYPAAPLFGSQAFVLTVLVTDTFGNQATFTSSFSN